MRIDLPSLEALVGLTGDSSDVSKHLQHNVQLWRWINGAFGMLKDETLAFDTQQDYWYRTDRRIVAAYLHRRLRESYYPAADLRALAQHLLRHFEGKVAAGGLGAGGLVREAEWPEYWVSMGGTLLTPTIPAGYRDRSDQPVGCKGEMARYML